VSTVLLQPARFRDALLNTQLVFPREASAHSRANVPSSNSRDLRRGERERHEPHSVTAEDLRLMNVAAASLFPGLDGYGRSMNGYLTIQDPSKRELLQALMPSRARDGNQNPD
jgi:hypothetical protein